MRALQCAQRVSGNSALKVVSCSRSALSHSSWILSRNVSSGSVAEAKPDYYRLLAVERDATPETIKQAFRDMAKRFHPDVLAAAGSVAAGDADHFKLINEAYSVLSDETLRKDYDSDRFFSRAALLRKRNEGTGIMSSDGTGNIVSFSKAGAGGLTAEELATLSPEEAFRRTSQRAQERARDSARFRATLARLNRPKIEVPSQDTTMWHSIGYPLGMVALFVLPYAVFLK